jgi:chorismate mutase
MAVKTCLSAAEALDRVEETDQRLVRLLALRVAYARQALAFDPASLSSHRNQLLDNLRAQAKIQGLVPDRVERLFRALGEMTP